MQNNIRLFTKMGYVQYYDSEKQMLDYLNRNGLNQYIIIDNWLYHKGQNRYTGRIEHLDK